MIGCLSCRQLLVSIALGAILSGCAAHQPTPPREEPQPLDESFDVLSLGVEELPLPKEARTERPADTTAVVVEQGATSDTTRAEELVPGYRVQVCATPDEATARAYYHDALMKFLDQGVYLRFDSPYYKVRIGDCKSRFEAEELQKRVQKSGFPDAWVVRTKVYANPQLRPREGEEPSQEP